MPPRQNQQRSQPLRRYEPGRRHMELIPSVSRSSGLEKDGDALRNFKLQEEYREFIQSKLDDYWKRHPYGQQSKDTKHRDEMQSNILILLRKLREGIMSTKRNDKFAVEVYETSMYLSILFASPAQTTSVISHLVPEIYKAHPDLPGGCTTASVTSLLHFLVAAYPSQMRFSEHLGTIPKAHLPPETGKWLGDLTRALRQHNFARIDRLSARSAVSHCLPTPTALTAPRGAPFAGAPADLASEALYTLLDSLRAKARDTTWLILRSAYRELSCPIPKDASPSFTRDWLVRSLALRGVASKNEKAGDEVLLDAWIAERASKGELRAKEGMDGRWIVAKIAP